MPETIVPSDVIAMANNMPVTTNVQDMFESVFSSKTDEWKRRKVEIGFLGKPGAGKSSLINALRGLAADDVGAAPIGVMEGTISPSCYAHPRYKNLELWDLPGIGTTKFNREYYLKSINLFVFECFIFVSCCRFTSDELWLANFIREKGKTVYFVRTKIGNDIRNDCISHPKTHDVCSFLTRIREDYAHFLQGRQTRLFLIDSYIPTEFDFQDLVQHIKKILVLSLAMDLKVLVDLKKEVLQRGIPWLSVRQLFRFEQGIREACHTQFKFYKDQLSLDESSLSKEIDEEIRSELKNDVLFTERLLLSSRRLNMIYSHSILGMSQKVNASKDWADDCLNELCLIAYKKAAMLCAKKVEQA